MARDTRSRGARSFTVGAYRSMNRSFSAFSRIPPSPRTASDRRMPILYTPVGWNWKNSMSSSGMPRRHATAGPSPVSVCALDDTRNIRPKPPVANMTEEAWNTCSSPEASSYATTPVAGPVGRVAGALDRSLAVVAGVAAEPALIDPSVSGPVEWQAPVLQLEDGVDCLLAHDEGRGLIHQVVAALHRVEGMPLPGGSAR